MALLPWDNKIEFSPYRTAETPAEKEYYKYKINDKHTIYYTRSREINEFTVDDISK